MKEKKIKQPKRGLKIEKDLSVVKNAGFRASRKRDSSVNRRAGLHDKAKNLRGERRIYRAKPLGIVRIRRIKQIVATLSACLVAVIAYFSMGFIFKPAFVYVEELGNDTVCAASVGDGSDAKQLALGVKGGRVAPATAKTGMYSAVGEDYYMPTDGSLPTDHTLIENVAYMNYVLQNQPCWSSYMVSTVNTVMKQHVYTHKKYYDGVLISADMPQGASNIARQFCVTDTDISWREKSENYVYDSMDNVAWPSGMSYGLTTGKFRIYRGLPADNFSVYILNELTVKNYDDTTVEEIGVDENGKKLYKMTLDLRVHQTGLDSAVHYYKQQMYVTGGLYDWPTFDYTYVEYTFTEDWVVKEFTINDKYAAKMGSVSAPCTSSSTTVFDYEEENAKNTYYGDYFSQPYTEWNPLSSKVEPTAASCLASAFGDVLTDGATLKLEMTVDGKPVKGAVHLGMENGGIGDLRVLLSGSSIGDIKLYLGEESQKQKIFVALGANKYKVSLDAFAGSQDGGVAAQSEDNQAEGETFLDTDALIGQLFEGTFELGKNGKTATLASKIEIFGLNVPVNFSFNIKKDVASLNEVTASFKLGKNDITARLTFGTEADIPAQLSNGEKTAYVDIFDGITLGANVKFGDVNIGGAAYIGFENGGLGEVRAKLGDVTLYYLPDGFVYFGDGNAKFKLNTAALSGDGSGLDISGLTGALDLKGIIEDLLGNFYMGGGTVSTALKLDFSEQLNQILQLAVSLDLNDGLGVDVNTELFGKPLSVGVSLTSQAVPAIADKTAYTDILNGEISLNANLGIDGVQMNALVTLGLADGNVNSVRASLQNGAVEVYYEKELSAGEEKEDAIYLALDKTVKIKLPLSALGGTSKTDVELGGIFGSLDIKSLITEIINNLKCENGRVGSSLTLNLGTDGNMLELPLNFGISVRGGIKVDAGAEIYGKKIAADVSLTNNAVDKLADKSGYIDIMNDGFAISGELELNAGGKVIGLNINGLALNFNGGFSFELDARLVADGKYFDVYASLLSGELTLVYGSDESTEDEKGNFVGVKINTRDDLDALGYALEETYARLCAVIDTIVPDGSSAIASMVSGVGASKTATNGLNTILSMLDIDLGENAGIEEIATSLGIPITDDGKIDIAGLINAVALKSVGNGIAVTLGQNISVNLGINESGFAGGAEVQLGNSSAGVSLTNIKIDAFAPECPVSANDLLKADDLIDLLDYVTAAFELASEEQFALDADVRIYEGTESAMDVDVLLEYNRGENGFPIHIDTGNVNEETQLRENVNFWIDPTASLHLNLGITDKKKTNGNMYIDLFVLDANPASTSTDTGKTNGGYTTDGKLDVYVSISNGYVDADGNSNPMKIYMPMEDILTIVAMGGAMLNLDAVAVSGSYNHITQDQLDELNLAIRQVANVINQLLIQNYIGGTESQFRSIGDSIVEQILRGQKIEASNLSELLNLLLNTVFGPADDNNGGNEPPADGEAETMPLDGGAEIPEETPETPVLPLLTSGNYVKRVELNRGGENRSFAVVLNSSAIYGSGFEDAVFEITKRSYLRTQEYEIMPADGELSEESEGQNDGLLDFPTETNTYEYTKSYIDGLKLTNIYFGENNANRLDIGANIIYSAAKPDGALGETFKDYYNFSDISTLLATFVNSATHEIKDENAPAEEPAEGDEIGTITATDIAKQYGLNSNYYISGAVQLGFVVELFGQSYNLGATINIEPFYVTINDDNTVEFNVTLSYNKVDIKIFTMIETAATVDLTIKDDMVYMRKTTDGGKTYTMRIMSLADFGKDILNQIQYILSFSDQLMDMIKGDGNSDSSGDGKLTFNDYGDYLSTFLAHYYFTEDENSASWNIGVNQQPINTLAGLDLFSESIKVAFNAERGADDTLSLKSLAINSKMFGLLTLSATLNYLNPQNIWEGGEDLSGNAVKLDCNAQYGVSGKSWTEVLGGTKFEDICKVVEWEKLCRETSGGKYLSYTGDNLHYGSVAFEYAEDKTNKNYISVGEPAIALYGNACAYSKGVEPSLEGIVSNPKAYEWSGFVTGDDGVAIIRANYKWHTVQIFSDYKIAGSIEGFTESEAEGGYIYSQSFSYGTNVDLSFIPTATTAIFKGLYNVETNEEAAASYNVEADAAFRIEWIGKSINITYVSTVALSEAEEQDGVYTVTSSMQYGVDNVELLTPETEAENMILVGWFMKDGEIWRIVNSVEEIIDMGSVTLEALWLKVDISCTSTKEEYRKTMFSTLYLYYYFESNITYTFEGKEELKMNITCNKTSYRMYVNNDGIYNSSDNHLTVDYTGYQDLEKQKIELADSWGSAKKSHWNIVVTLTFTLQNGLTYTTPQNATMHLSGKY